LHLTVFCQLYIARTIRGRERVCDEAAGLCHSTPRAVGYHGEPRPRLATQCGAVTWGVTAGKDEFLGVTGDIASIIAVSATDEVVDNYYARMIFP
jgi:hypothetical protein